jgi:murein DD-endopeptidase MepM/ murein hydrolase activator NlpD
MGLSEPSCECVLATKKINIFLVPEGTSRVKQLRLPRFLPAFLAILFVSCVAFSFWMIRDYHEIKSQMPRLARLEKENELKDRQFVHLSKRLRKVLQRVAELKELDQKLKVMVNLETGDDKTQFRGLGGTDPGLMESNYPLESSHKELVRSMHHSLDRVESEVISGSQDKTELHKFLKSQRTLLASTPSIWPAKGWLSSGFGYRESPFTGTKEFHRGIDISTRTGSPVLAPADGIVSAADRNRTSGKMLTISHGYGLATKYAHLKKFLVKKGQHVKRGETIALVGNTGRCTGPHLHYEVYFNKLPVNPLQYILD